MATFGLEVGNSVLFNLDYTYSGNAYYYLQFANLNNFDVLKLNFHFLVV